MCALIEVGDFATRLYSYNGMPAIDVLRAMRLYRELRQFAEIDLGSQRNSRVIRKISQALKSIKGSRRRSDED